MIKERETIMLGDRTADLHTHSIISDGELSVGLLIKEAEKNKIRYLSITDHENTSQVEETLKILRLNNTELKIIPGVEISTLYQNEEIHIVAYFNYTTINKLNEIITPLREQKKIRVEKTLSLLREIGIDVPYYSITNCKRTVNRMNIARYIYNNSNFNSIEQVFKKYFDEDPKFKLEPNYPQTDEIIKKLNSIGCVVGIAHPNFLKDWNKISIIENLIKQGVKGIEVFHPTIPDNLTISILKYAQEKDLIPLGGSDFHGYDTKRKELGMYNTFTNSAVKIIQLLNL